MSQGVARGGGDESRRDGRAGAPRRPRPGRRKAEIRPGGAADPAGGRPGEPGVEEALEINRLHRELEQAFLEEAREIGRRLLGVKQRLGHGRFGAWVKGHCDFGPRMASNYIRIEEDWDRLQLRAAENRKCVSDLGVGGAIKLLSTPRASSPDRADRRCLEGPRREVETSPEPTEAVVIEMDLAADEQACTVTGPPAPISGEIAALHAPRGVLTPEFEPAGEAEEPEAASDPEPEPIGGGALPAAADHEDRDAPDREAVAAIRGGFRAELRRIMESIRPVHDGDPGRCGRLWRELRPAREQLSALVQASSPRLWDECPRCRAGDPVASCPVCAGVGYARTEDQVDRSSETPADPAAPT